MVHSTQGTKKFPAFIALSLVLLATAAAQARHSHPEGWKVKVQSHPISKHGMYEINALVRDENGKPVDDATVEVRLHSFKEAGYRMVQLRRAGKGWYRTWNRLNTPHDQPGRLKAVVTP